MNKRLILAEAPFISIQGEGNSIGKVSTFIRFQNCNLRCAFCDSKFTWEQSVNLEKYSCLSGEDFIKDFKSILIKENSSNIIFTGGEPTLYQKEIIQTIVELEKTRNFTYFDCDDMNTYEIETNLTIPLNEEFLNYVELNSFMFQLNISPKLQFKEYIDTVLNNILTLTEHGIFFILKFVDDGKEETRKDILSFLDSLNNKIIPYLSLNNIYIMPECVTRQEHLERFETTLNFCKEHGFNFSPRVHILLWDKKRGV